MPIFINKYFPSIHLHVDTIANEENKIRTLVSIGVVMNTCNKDYHYWVIFQYPSMVSEYLECGPGTEYNIV